MGLDVADLVRAGPGDDAGELPFEVPDAGLLRELPGDVEQRLVDRILEARLVFLQREADVAAHQREIDEYNAQVRAEREKAIAAGCAEFDTKPIEFDRLVATVRRVLDGRK